MHPDKINTATLVVVDREKFQLIWSYTVQPLGALQAGVADCGLIRYKKWKKKKEMPSWFSVMMFVIDRRNLLSK